ncbi:trypsin-like peptidase domain-containing protein [Mameliella alba]|nr:trypsin-like peptidase domain-containing protein [Antarctobacter heliothermus]MBY6144480.1 trypsin-like peptidase domain-containing protein [Mameliella alba]MCA0954529.1 trypsin-like peptidase domain-containing protein [Mameliella alba]
MPVFRMAAAAILALSTAAAAQDLMLFPAETFGQVVAPRTESMLGDVRLESRIGDYNNEFISNYGPNSVFARTGRSVGMLQILTNVGHAPCTGFLVEGNRIVTNHHCVPGILNHPKMTAQGANSIADVQFHVGYTRDGLDEGVKTFHVNPVPLETSEALDYTVLQVLGDANAEFGALDLTAAVPQDRDPFWVIGHPMGEAQRISREKCQADSPALAKQRLRHTCDTLPGNSGSPVIDAGSQKVIALHHAGSRAGDVNFAVPMADILAQSKVLKAASPAPAAPETGERDAELALAAALAELEKLRAEKEALQARPDPKPEPVAAPAPDPTDTREILRKSQAHLNTLGCDAGAADGVMGPRTREAFRRFLAATGVALTVEDLGTVRALAAITATSGRICKTVAAAPPAQEPPEATAPTYSMVGTWSWSATCPLGIATGTSTYRSTGGNGFSATITSTAGPGTTQGTLNGRQYTATETYGWITNSASGRLSADGRSLTMTVSNGCRVTARKN